MPPKVRSEQTEVQAAFVPFELIEKSRKQFSGSPKRTDSRNPIPSPVGEG
ncbi:hypothetical protein [Eikenella halliae]|nr:hypothetical protein [Eikenella halliae]